jgi:hypothetical protein
VGPGAGQQGPITIQTQCNGTALTPDFVIDPRAPAGDQFKRYDDIPAGADCTVTETADGSTSAVSVVVEGSGQTVSVPAGGVVEADISDTYGLRPGQLEVTKTIAGPLAGEQGKVIIHTVCNGAALTPDFVIPARTPASDQSHVYSGIPTPADCVATETTDGQTSTVLVAVTGSPHTSMIPAGGSGAAHITDSYGPAPPIPIGSVFPGSLLVTKTIAGPLAGHQGSVTIHVVCNGIAVLPNFVIRAGRRAGTVSHSFDSIPPDSVCTVAETRDGATARVSATVAGNNQMVTVPAGKVVPVSLSDVYQGTLGSLTVTKTIAGPAAHRHGGIAILVACGGPVNDFAFRIQSRVAGAVPRYFNGLPAGSRCTVTESAEGGTATVAVAAKGKRKTVTIHANGRAAAKITDRFAAKPAAVTRPPAGLG